MRFIEILNGVNVPIFEEEELLVNKIKETGKIFRSKLTEREQELARILTSRGILKREKVDNMISYCLRNNPKTT